MLASGLRADPPGRQGAEALLLSALEMEDGLRFTRAHASSPSPLVSMGTVLTGRYPSAIPMCGLTHTGTEAEQQRPWCSILPQDVPLLPEILALYGYETALVRSRALGFDTFGEHFGSDFDLPSADGSADTPWGALTEAATGWWQDHAASPRLLVVVVSDLLYTQRPDVKAELGVVGWSGETPSARQGLPVLRHAAFARYEADAREVGRQLGALWRGLQPASRPCWAILGSTGGLSIGEIRGQVSQRDFFFTRSLVQDRILHVPLVMRGPAGVLQPGERGDLVQLLDLLPTITNLAGAVPPAGIAGGDLLAPPQPDRVVYAEFGDMLGVWQGRYGLVFKVPMHNHTSLDPSLDVLLFREDHAQHLFLYDVLADPLQLRSLVVRGQPAPAEFDALYQEMVRIRRGPGAPPPEAMSPEHLKEIRLTAAEGYW